MSETIEKATAISQSAFAELAGVSRKSVTVWKTKGYLDFYDDGLVIVETSVQNLKERGLGNFQQEETTKSAFTPASETVTSANDDAAAEAAEMLMQMNDGRVALKLLSFAEAERMKEIYAALHARLRFEKEASRLVEKEPVERKLTEMWAGERDAQEVWPSVVCGTLAAEFGIDQIKLRVALERLVEDHLKKRVRDPLAKS